MTNYASNLTDVISRKVSSVLQELLETKHLYQSVQISEKDFNEVINSIIEEHKREASRAEPGINLDGTPYLKNRVDKLNKERDALLYSDWYFYTESNPPPGVPPIGSVDLPPLPLPSVRVSCGSKQCKGSIQPHNSGFVGLRYGTASFDFQQDGSVIQIFSFPYQCQNCKEDPLVFLVKRDDLKLTLVGRSQFPEVSVPDFIPDAQRKFYRNAIIADQTSFTLAAALYLRTVIEQYFHSTIPEVEIKAIKGNPTGDELADLYAKTLPKNFPSNFPSLKKAYNDLSEIVHSGKENDEVKKSFSAIRTAVDGHFRAVQLFKQMPTQ
ncbi:MAG: hypothetical protein ABSF10_12190 [Verrucomicrobiota bacterium]|jgi:hypothetical protein